MGTCQDQANPAWAGRAGEWGERGDAAAPGHASRAHKSTPSLPYFDTACYQSPKWWDLGTRTSIAGLACLLACLPGGRERMVRHCRAEPALSQPGNDPQPRPACLHHAPSDRHRRQAGQGDPASRTQVPRRRPDAPRSGMHASHTPPPACLLPYPPAMLPGRGLPHSACPRRRAGCTLRARPAHGLLPPRKPV